MTAALSSMGLDVFDGAQAAEAIRVREANLDPGEGGYELSAQFEFELPQGLEDAINKGIALYFATDFELTRPRWYWFDETAATATRVTRLSFQPLTRQYRVSTGGLQLRFATLAEALGFIKTVRNWRVVDRSALKAGETYLAQVRMRLDLTQLPKPFQVNAVNSRDWTLGSEWRHFPLVIQENGK